MSAWLCCCETQGNDAAADERQPLLSTPVAKEPASAQQTPPVQTMERIGSTTVRPESDKRSPDVAESFNQQPQNNEATGQPLPDPLTPVTKQPASARQTPPVQTVERIGSMTVKRVGVPELDKRFLDVAESFNEQQQNYEAAVRRISGLRQSWECTRGDAMALTECVGKIRDEHKAKYLVTLKMNGYNFFLTVAPVQPDGESSEEPLPPSLKSAQDELQAISRSAMATISKGTSLQEMFGWVLRGGEQMAKQVKEAAPNHQDEGRLNGNLEENITEVRRAKELSVEYRQKAREVLTEAAHIAGSHV